MKWIKYEYVCGTDSDGAEILAKKRVGYNESNLAIAEAEAYNGEYTIEDDGKNVDNTSNYIGNINMNGNRVTNLGTPVDSGDATSKQYVDESLAKAQLEGAGVDTTNFVMQSDLKKVTDVVCDETYVNGNYNLFKPSEVAHSARLQDDVSGKISSTVANAVTGWIPVEYGKYYCMSVLYDGSRTTANTSYQRMNLKLSDGTIVVYNKTKVPQAIEHSKKVINIEYEDAVAMMVHFQIAVDESGLDISSSTKLKTYEPMLVEGNTADEAYQNAMTFEYLDGDAVVDAEVIYSQKHDDTKADKTEVAKLSGILEGFQQVTSDGAVIGALYSRELALQNGERVNTNSKWGVVTDYIQCCVGDTITIDSDDYTFQVMEYREKDVPLVYSGVLNYGSTYTVTLNGYVCISIRYADTSLVATKSLIDHIVANLTGYYDIGKIEKRAYGAELSPFFRSVNYGILPSSYYQGLGDSYESKGFVQNTLYADFIAAWKEMVAGHSGYVTETNLGNASDGQALYLYDFKPARIANADKDIPKIILIAGQHGFEKSNIFGLYYFIDNLLNKWDKHQLLEYLRNNVELMIVPVLNTYGFDNLEYKNANGVNTNRNYDSHWELVSDTTSSQYGGAEPFDQPETQIIRDLLADNLDASLVIDFHTNGQSSVANYYDVNWCATCESTDNYYNRMKDAIAHHLSAITAHFNLDYELNQSNVMMGHMTNDDGTGLLRNWAYDNNIVGVLVEGFNGFPNRTHYTPEVYKANEEIIANYLFTAMYYLSK